MRRIVSLVEGDGDCLAVPRLLARICHDKNINSVHIDNAPIRIGGYSALLKDNYNLLKRHINNALRRHECDRVLLLLDGDTKQIGGKKFCVKNAIPEILGIAESEGAGIRFQFEVVFALQEFESWIIAGLPANISSITNEDFSFISLPNVDFDKLEESPRDAKKALSLVMAGSYKETIHQVRLIKLLDLSLIASRMRSFRKMCNAVIKLCS